MNYRKGVRKVSERRTTQYDNRPPIDNHNYLRSNRNNRKRRSWVSLIIQIIIFILVAITGYSMYKQPIFNLAFANQPISYGQIKDFQNTVTQIGTLNINLSQLANLEDVANRLVFVLTHFHFNNCKFSYHYFDYYLQSNFIKDFKFYCDFNIINHVAVFLDMQYK